MSAIGIVMVASACASSVGIFGLFFWKHFASLSQNYSYAKCPSCRQRIRFLTRKAGRGGQCPRCLKTFTLAAQAGAARLKTAAVRATVNRDLRMRFDTLRFGGLGLPDWPIASGSQPRNPGYEQRACVFCGRAGAP